MKRLRKIVASVLLASILLQPLGLITPVLAETVDIQFDNTHPLHAPEVVNDVAYEYDANGNLVNDGERTIEWNQDNKPIRIEKDGQVVEFFYDASGRRTVKRSGDNKTVYVNQYYEQRTENNEQKATKHYFANGRVAQSIDSTLTFLHQDHLGSTVLATNSESQPTSNPLSYFPYGEQITNHQLPITSYLFTGQESDSESDLYNYNARLYNPTTGVFISADSVQRPNRYAYAGNNPMVYVDPTGNEPRLPDLPGISATTPINPTIGYDPYNPDPSYYDPYTYGPTGEFEQLIVGMAVLSSAVVTVVLAAPVVAAQVATAWANRQAGKVAYVESITAEAESYGIKVTPGGPSNRPGVAGCVYCVETGPAKAIPPGTQIWEMGVYTGDDIGTIAHELDTTLGHTGQLIDNYWAGVPDARLGAGVSHARIGYEIKASIAALKAGAQYGTSPRDFFSMANAVSNIAAEVTGGMTAFRVGGNSGSMTKAYAAFFGYYMVLMGEASVGYVGYKIVEGLISGEFGENAGGGGGGGDNRPLFR